MAMNAPCQAWYQTAPVEELTDIIEWLGEVVRQTDSSLLDEWEQLVDPDLSVVELVETTPPVRTITSNVRAFRVLVRNAMFRRVELLARSAPVHRQILDPLELLPR